MNWEDALDRELTDLLIMLIKHRYRDITGLDIPGQRQSVMMYAKYMDDFIPTAKAMMDDVYIQALRRVMYETGLDNSFFPPRCPWSFEEAVRPDLSAQ
ncbi:DUF29 family protein [Salmonella enterica subsp. enterica serovar Saintpaul]|nr:DUF29 family protein [Salmonella enterica subsp. enterica serovar Saintpaul]